MATLTCDIVTPAKKLFTSECHMVVVPGIEGEMGFLGESRPAMSTLADGTVRVLSDASTVAHRFAAAGRLRAGDRGQGHHFGRPGSSRRGHRSRRRPCEDFRCRRRDLPADDSADKNLAEVTWRGTILSMPLPLTSAYGSASHAGALRGALSYALNRAVRVRGVCNGLPATSTCGYVQRLRILVGPATFHRGIAFSTDSPPVRHFSTRKAC